MYLRRFLPAQRALQRAHTRNDAGRPGLQPSDLLDFSLGNGEQPVFGACSQSDLSTHVPLPYFVATMEIGLLAAANGDAAIVVRPPVLASMLYADTFPSLWFVT
jgi:hypothetical protein